MSINIQSTNSDFGNCLTRRWSIVALLLCASTLVGCGPVRNEYRWAPYPVDPARVNSDLTALNGAAVSIAHEGNDTAEEMIGELGRHKYYSSHDELAEAITIQLEDELRNLQVDVDDSNQKTLNIKVSNATTERGMWVIKAHLRLTVEAGNGYVLEKPISNATPMTVPRAFNGAVVFSVIEILNDPEITSYLID